MRIPRVRVALSCLVLFSACTGRSPSAPTAPPAPPPVGTAAAITLTPNSWDMPAGGGSIELVIATSANTAGSIAAPNVPVSLHASSGSLSDEAPQTDRTGHARVIWTGTSAATITARAGDAEGTAQIRVPQAAPAPPPPGPRPNPPPDPPQPPNDPPTIPDDNPKPAGDLVATIGHTPAAVEAGVDITYTATLTSSTGAAVPAVRFSIWDLDGDRLPDHFDASPKIKYTTAGTITVELEIRTADNRAVHAKSVVTVAPAPGVAATLTATPTSVTLNQPVTLTAQVETAGDVGTLSYAWDFDANDTVDQTTGSNTTTTSYATIGAKTPKVTVTGSRGGSATATAAAVTVSAPPLRISSLTVSGTKTAGSQLTFTATVSADSGSVPPSMSFRWDFGNGSEVVTSASPNNINHTYASAGTYTVKVTVTSPDGRTATETISVVVS